MNNRILLVEDEVLIREAFAIVLGANDFRVTSAANGQQALDLCARNTFDLILLDLMMPVLDGVGFLRRANLHKTAPKTKVILFSNLSSGEAVEEAAKLGIHRHEIKANLSPRQIVELVRKELGMSTLEDSKEHAQGRPASSAKASA